MVAVMLLALAVAAASTRLYRRRLA
jgi:hypothetical protein